MLGFDAVAETALCELPSIGGTVYSASVSETGTGADTVSSSAVLASALAEAMSAADTVSAAARFASTVAEALSAAETVSAKATYPSTISESGSALDAPVGRLVISGAVAEVLTALDAQSGAFIFVGSLSESAGAVDVLNGVFPNMVVVDTVRYSQHPVNCYMEGLPQYRFLENVHEPASGTKPSDKVTASTGGARRLSKNLPTFKSVTKKGGFIE